MRVTFYGTRGSIPVSGPEYCQYGGNTTSVEVSSYCLPKDTRLVIDAGTGFLPLSKRIFQEQAEQIAKGLKVYLLFSHYHHDHTMGLLLSPLTFCKTVEMNLYGPKDKDVGPREMMEAIMKPPFFPVHCKKVKSHFSFKGLDHPETYVLVFHPGGGIKLLPIDEFERLVEKDGYVPVGKSGKYPVDECLVISMYASNHPERTISYRLEERTSGKVFVFLTDHENQDGIPVALRGHISGADLLILDAQYNQDQYEKFTAGYGHGTGPYCARLAWECEAKKLGLTHHDPLSGDQQVMDILGEARGKIVEMADCLDDDNPLLSEENIFACQDYQTVEV